MIKFCLPFPPSSNTLFRNGGFKGKRPKTKRYLEWIVEAGWRLKELHVKPISGPVKIIYELQNDARGNALWDYANREKAVTDLLVEHGIIEADHRLILKSVECRGSDEIEGVSITITQWVEACK